MKTIGELEAEVERAYSQLSLAKIELRDARLEAAPVKMGDIVRSTQSRTLGKLGLVCFVDVRWGHEKPNIHVHPQRKDGSYGTAIRHWTRWWEVVK